MSSKKIIIIIILLLLIGLTLYLIIKEEKDSVKFKNEYEKYNNLTFNNNDKIEKFHNVEIDKKNPIIYLTEENVIEELNGENKLVFLGTPEDNNSRKAISTLLKVANENGIEKIYYYNIENEKSKNYKEILKKIDKETLEIPVLMLIKNKKIENYSQGITKEKELYEKYEEIMIDYLMCTSSC